MPPLPRAPAQPRNHLPQALGVDTVAAGSCLCWRPRLCMPGTCPPAGAPPSLAGASRRCSGWAPLWHGHTSDFSATQKLDLPLPPWRLSAGWGAPSPAGLPCPSSPSQHTLYSTANLYYHHQRILHIKLSLLRSLCSFCLQVGPRLIERCILRRNDEEGLMVQINYIFIVMKSEGGWRVKEQTGRKDGTKEEERQHFKSEAKGGLLNNLSGVNYITI